MSTALRNYYRQQGIKCFECCAAGVETFAEGAKVHEGGPFGTFDPEKVVKDLNDLAEKHPLDESKYQKKTLWARIVDLLFPSETSPTDPAQPKVD